MLIKKIGETIFWNVGLIEETMKRILVLSGGGIPGICVHTGALKALYERRMNFDVVIGTSAGAFIGYLYSLGYSVDLIDYIVFEKINWLKLSLKNLNPKFWQGFMTGKSYINLLKELKRGSLQKRFIAIACNLENGLYKLWHKNITPEKVVSSMAVPVLFKPQEINGIQYGDGGITKNLGVEVAKRIANKEDYILAIDIISGEIHGKVRNIFSYIFRIIDITRSQLKREDLEEVRGMIDYVPVRIKGCLLPDKRKMMEYWLEGYHKVLYRRFQI